MGAHTGSQKKTTLQRSAIRSEPTNEAPPIVHEVLRAPGQPLDSATRAFMEPRFGHDFSQVRVHTGTRAAESARSVDALAYTVGQDIVFNSWQYAPGTSGGQELLAHELAHVVQQNAATAAVHRQVMVGSENSPAEANADRLAEEVMDTEETSVDGVIEIEQILGAVTYSPSLLQRRCQKSPPASTHTVDINYPVPATPPPNHTHNTAWISARAQDPSGNTAGLTEFRGTMRYHASFGGDQNNIWLRSFTSSFPGARIRIFLTSQFPTGSCQYNDLLRHEQQHDTDFRTNLAEAETRICDNATTWPSRSFPMPKLSFTADNFSFLLREWMEFENWQLNYDNWDDGCTWDWIDYPRMYSGCPGIQAAVQNAVCSPAPVRPVQHGLPLPQKAVP